MNGTKVISVLNWKGGVGKTTLTHHLGTGLQELTQSDIKQYLHISRYPRVLLIDLDAQCNLSISCLRDDKFENYVYVNNTPTIKDLIDLFLTQDKPGIEVNDYILHKLVRRADKYLYSNVDLLPAHQDLIFSDMNIAAYSKADFRSNLLNSDIYKFRILHRILQQVRKEYDFIFIDCPPNLNFITQNALYASDYFLVPTIPDKLSSYGIASIIHKVNSLNKTFASACEDYTETKLAGIVANNVIDRGGPKASQANILAALKTTYPDNLFECYLTYGDGIAIASAEGIPVYALGTSLGNASKQSLLLKNILKELLARLEGDQ